VVRIVERRSSESIGSQGDRSVNVEVTFQVHTAESIKIAAFWIIAPYNVVKVCRRFRHTCCLHHRLYDRALLKLITQLASFNTDMDLLLSMRSEQGSAYRYTWGSPTFPPPTPTRPQGSQNPLETIRKGKRTLCEVLCCPAVTKQNAVLYVVPPSRFEKSTVSILNPEDGDSKFLRNVGEF
jgi:hypothetical protein